MSNINKQALRSTSDRDWFEDWFKREFHPDKTGPYIKDQLFFAVRAARAPLLDELEAKDAQVANLTAERDALREGEMGDAKHSNTRAAADIYFQLVEECGIPAGGSLVEHVDDMRDRLSNSEQQIAELIAAGIITKVGE